MQNPILGIKIDVDTEVGTRKGIPNMLKLLSELGLRGVDFKEVDIEDGNI